MARAAAHCRMIAWACSALSLQPERRQFRINNYFGKRRFLFASREPVLHPWHFLLKWGHAGAEVHVAHLSYPTSETALFYLIAIIDCSWTSGIVNRSMYSVRTGSGWYTTCYNTVPPCSALFEYVLFTPSTYQVRTIYSIYVPSTYPPVKYVYTHNILCIIYISYAIYILSKFSVYTI